MFRFQAAPHFCGRSRDEISESRVSGEVEGGAVKNQECRAAKVMTILIEFIPNLFAA